MHMDYMYTDIIIVKDEGRVGNLILFIFPIK
jgi:hypothetical protein